MENEIPDPIQELIYFLSDELRQEIIINKDGTSFWLKAMSHIFENSIVSVKENLRSLSEAVTSDTDLFNYMSAFVCRVFSQPFTRDALKRFSDGFDEIAADDFFRDGFGFDTKGMTMIEKFLLFLTAHRNQIQIVFLEAEAVDEQNRLKAIADSKKRK